jgi:hypothetical protein
MNYLLLALAILTALIGFLYGYRFLLFAVKKAYFSSLLVAFVYAGVSAGLLAAAVVLFQLATT